jgi:hypothetical protein
MDSLSKQGADKDRSTNAYAPVHVINIANESMRKGERNAPNSGHDVGPKSSGEFRIPEIGRK